MPRPREDKSVRLSMSGEEFKTLIERFTDNGRIDTVPELMETAADMPSIINEKVQDAMDNISTATDEDITDLFGGEQDEQQPIVSDGDGDGIDDSLIADDEDIESLYR